MLYFIFACADLHFPSNEIRPAQTRPDIVGITKAFSAKSQETGIKGAVVILIVHDNHCILARFKPGEFRDENSILFHFSALESLWMLPWF